MKHQRGMTFISMMILIILGVSITLLGVKLAPSYIEFFSVKKIMSAMAKDPAFPTMSPQEVRNSFDRRATIDYVDSVNGKDLDISKENGQNVASVEYSKKIPLVLNISACLEFEASTSK
ncbi:MAG: DUF4845 domain-containing protein [Hydrogenophilales bacterium]|nr:DUF4845 domain-containing protein [Hydrogenophilales bacterium]